MANSFTNLVYHIVFSTKNRYPLITNDLQNGLYACIAGLTAAKRGILLEIGGIEDHVHLLVKMKPNLSLSDLVRYVKTNSSRWMNEKTTPAKTFLWQGGYGAFTVSTSRLPDLRCYLRNQREHHKRRTFHDEFMSFLNHHEIKFEEDGLLS